MFTSSGAELKFGTPQQMENTGTGTPPTTPNTGSSTMMAPTDVPMAPTTKSVDAPTPKRKKPVRLHRRRRRGGGGRLWQLPESSVQEYAKWIENKPVSDQSPAEQKFLWKFQRRCHLRQHKLANESMKAFIARLEQQESRTPIEETLIAKYHHRRRARKGKGAHPPPVFWRRNKNGTASPAMLSSIANLRESMDQMGLSCQNLRDSNSGGMDQSSK